MAIRGRKMSKKPYELEQQGEEITFLDDRSKIDEAFAMAKTGAITYVEEFSGKKFVIMTLEKFDEIFKKLEEATADE